MSPRLHHSPRLHLGRHLLPLLPVLLKRCQKGLVLFFGPAAGVLSAGGWFHAVGVGVVVGGGGHELDVRLEVGVKNLTVYSRDFCIFWIYGVH